MLRFLRIIRKTLIESNQLKKYVLYTVGEILLVVIGILIALQINNKNEFRKERIEEKNFLQSLSQDLKASEAHFTQVNSEVLNQQSVINAFIDGLHTSVSMDSLEQLALVFCEEGWWTYNIQPITSTYREMESSGKLSILSNEDLKKQIINYYNSLQFQMKNFNDIIQATWDMDIHFQIKTFANKMLPEVRAKYLKFDPKLVPRTLINNSSFGSQI